MDAYEETFETWNAVAALYESKFMKLSVYNPSYDAVIHHLGKNPVKILEVGCGPGNIANYFLDKRPTDAWLGTDISTKMIALAQKNNPKGIFKVLDVREISSLQQQFDVLIAGFCLPYMSLADIGQFLLDATMLLEGGGMLYLSFVEGTTDKSGFQTNSKGNRMYFYYHQLEDLQELLGDCNFELTQTFYITQEKQEKQTVLIAQLQLK